MDQNITALPWLTKSLMSSQCYQTLIINHDFLNLPCLQAVFSKILGYAIVIITSTLMKTPQIVKILKARSGEGVSFFSQFLMLISSSSNVAYSVARHYPMSLWGESIAIALQTLVILLLILIYQDRSMRSVLFTVCYLLGMLLWLSPSIPMSFHIAMQTVAVFLGSFSKIVQIWTTKMNSGTGQLSAMTTHLMNFRSIGRLYTSIRDTQDILPITEFGIHTVLNILLSVQFIYYKNSKMKKHQNKKG
jgi:mannose-P-dolichol utilization defect protein 1